MHVNVHWSDCPMCSCKWGVSRVTEMCVKLCSESIVLFSAHLHAHVRHTGHCTFTCTWCVHVNVQWFDCLMCSCKWTVSPMADVCMKMCTEPFIWISAHLDAHLRHTRHCTFTCNWCVHVNVQLFDCLMCSMIGQWAQWPMCAWKCAVSQLSDSLHIYMHTSDTRVTARLRACKSDCLMCSIIGQWAQWPICAWKCAVSQLSDSLHIYMHTSHTRVAHVPDVCL